MTPTILPTRMAATGTGSARPEPHGAGVAHESPPVMTVPLMVLAVFAVGVGFLLGPLMPHGMQFAPLPGEDALLPRAPTPRNT